MTSKLNEYITHTDFSRLVLYARLKILDVKVERPRNLDTDLARQLLADIDQGRPSKGYKADFKRIQRIAGMFNKYEKSKKE